MTNIVNMTVHVRITAEDIAEGKRGNCWRCPGALALIRALQESGVQLSTYTAPGGDTFINLSVDDNSVEFTTSDGHFYLGYTPAALREFISRFDKEEEVTPTQFLITVER